MSLKNLGTLKQLTETIDNVREGSADLHTLSNALQGLSQDAIMSAGSMLGLSAEQLTCALSASGLTSAEIANSLALNGYSKQAVYAALQTLGLKNEQIDAAMANINFAASTGVATTGLSAFGTTLKYVTTGLIQFLTTNPVGWAILTAGAIFGAVTAYDALTVSIDEAVEKARESKDVLAETNSEIESLYNEKQSNLDKIAELREADPTANKEEIESLERQNALLQAQIALKEKLAEDQRADAADAAYDALSKKTTVYTGGMQYVAGEWVAATEQMDIVDVVSKDISDLDELTAKYNAVNDQIAEYGKKTEDGTELTEAEAKELKKLTKEAESYESQMDSLEDIIDGNKQTILELYESLLNPDGTAITGYETMVDRILAIFPELADGSSLLGDNLQAISDAYKNAIGDNIAKPVRENLSKEFDNWLLGLSETDQSIVYDLYCNTDTALYSLDDWKTALAETKAQVEELSDIPIDISAETSGIESVTSAISESNSATGLSADRISELTSRYRELDGFDANRLFTNTATGVRINARELNNLEKQYESLNKQKIQKRLKELTDEYDDLTKQIEDYDDISETATKDLKAQRDAIEDQIDSTKALAAQYNGLTSAYNEWLNAQSATQSGDWYDSAKEGLESLKKLYQSGDYGNTALQEGLEYFTGIDITGIDNWQDRMKAIDTAYAQLSTRIDGTTYSINDFMTGGQNGCNAFLNAIQQVNKDWAKFDAATGSWELNYDKNELAAEFGTTVEFIEMMQDKLEQYGFQFDDVESRIEDIKNAVTDIPEDRLEATKKIIEEVNSSDVAPDIKTDRLEELYALVDDLVTKANQPAFMDIDVSSVETSLQEPLNLLKQYQSAVNEAKAFEIKCDMAGLDAANAKVADFANQLAQLDTEILASLGFKLDGVAPADLVKTIQEQIPTLEIPTTSQVTQEHVSVIYEKDTSQIDGYQPKVDPVTVTFHRDSTEVDLYDPDDLDRDVTYHIKTVGSLPGNKSFVGGKSNAGGTLNSASGGDTLTGELGREIVVDPNTNRWYTVGDHGAEFTNIPRNAIVFNHKQTESLLSHGRITGRGKALASGNAYVVGKPQMAAFGEETVVNVVVKPAKNTSTNVTNGGGILSQTDSTATEKAEEKAKSAFDWIEVALKRIEKSISRLKSVATSAYKSLSTKLSATEDTISLITREIEMQEQAYARYMQEAEAIELPEEIKELVRNGTIDIAQYDEETQKLIGDYQELYESAEDCSDAVDELHEDLASMYEESFNNILDDFENQLEQLDHTINTLNTSIDSLEARGYLQSTVSYESLIEAEQQRIATLNEELVSLEDAFKTAMDSGEIEEGSDAWYEMQGNINDVREEIDEANLSLLEYQKTMREIEWSHFDFWQELNSELTKESEFLIELLSSSPLFGDNGQLTNEGLSTVGLHAVNHNVYMTQADQYAEELLEVQKELDEDPYNTDIIKRKQELLALQQESILAAEAEKQAIADLVQEGIDLELDSLKELIDTYADALDSAKDLYDYQRKIKDHTSEISSIQKQLLSYENDTSEETKSKVQQLKVKLEEAKTDLEDSEYDQYITDQKKLLDEMYIEYETILNERLDNIDALFGEMIDSVNSNADVINQTLISATASVGYQMTEGLSTIWATAAEELIKDREQRAQDMASLLNQMVQNGQISAEDAKKILDALGAGDEQGIKNAQATIDELVANGSLSVENANGLKTTLSAETDKSLGVVSDYNDGFSEELTSTGIVMDDIKLDVEKLVRNSDEEASKGVPNTNVDVDVNTEVNIDNDNTVDVDTQVDTDVDVDVAVDVPDATTQIVYVDSSQDNTNTNSNNNVGGGSPRHEVSYKQFDQFATGGLADYTGIAWLDGTPTKPELVLNPEDTANFLALKDTLNQMKAQGIEIGSIGSYSNNGASYDGMIADITHVLSAIRNSDRATSANSFGDINITIPIDHVEDYNDFVNQLRNDKKFEQMIRAMTIDGLVGGSQFAKYKNTW